MASGPVFVSIGSDGAKLSTFALSGLNPAVAVPGTITVQTLTDMGSKDKLYKYYQNMPSGPFAGKKGWFDESNQQVTAEKDVTFPRGQGLWIKGLANVQLTISGEVDLSEYTQPLTAKSVLTCNPYPVAIYLSKNVELLGLNPAVAVPGTITVQTLTDMGSKDRLFKYYQNMPSGPFAGKKGWFDESNTQISADNDFEIPAGKGLWIKGLANTSIKFSYEADAAE